LIASIAAFALSCQALVGLDRFEKVKDADVGVMDVIDVIDAGPDVILFGEASVVHRWARWVMPNPPNAETDANIASYDTNAAFAGDAGPAIKDNLTGLVWSKYDYGVHTYAEAYQLCESLGLRLPTRIELVSLLDYTTNMGATIDSVFDASTNYYWTQSPALPSSTSVWVVNFANATLEPLDLTSTAFVRCVQ
jgi:hypothetical protein